MSAYTTEQYEQNYPDGIADHFWNHARNLVIADTLAAGKLAGKRILEVGCGTGVVVKYLRHHGFDCTGCELGHPRISGELANHIHTGTDARNLSEDLRAHIDVLLLCDVIEHVAEPALFLRGLAAAFPNARHLVATVPARREIWTNYDEHFGHHLRYDQPTLAAELRQAGFLPTQERYFFHALYVLMGLFNILRVRRSINLRVPSRLWLHRLLASYCRWEARILPGSVIGSSLIAVAERVRSPVHAGLQSAVPRQN